MILSIFIQSFLKMYNFSVKSFYLHIINIVIFFLKNGHIKENLYTEQYIFYMGL